MLTALGLATLPAPPWPRTMHCHLRFANGADVMIFDVLYEDQAGASPATPGTQVCVPCTPLVMLGLTEPQRGPGRLWGGQPVPSL